METTKELNRLIKLKQRYKKSSNIEKLIDVFKKIGDLYFETEKYEDALQEYAEQLELCESIDDKLQCSIAHRMIGECYINVGLYNEASSHLHKYLAGAKELENLLEQQRAYATLGRLYFCKAENEPQDEKKLTLNEAKEAYSESIILCERLEENKLLSNEELASMKARLLLNFGLVHETQDFKESCKWLESAEALCIDFSLSEELSRTYIALASVNERHGNIDKCISYFDTAANTNIQSLKVNALIGKSELFLRLGKWREARQVLVLLYKMKNMSINEKKTVEQSLKIVVLIMRLEEQVKSKTQDSEKIDIFDKLGDLAVKVHNYTIAITYYEKMLQCCETTANKRLGEALVSLARTLQDMGRYEEAIIYAKRELKLNTSYSDICTSALFLANLQTAASSTETEIRDTFDLAMENAVKSKNVLLKKSVLKEQLLYFENTQQEKEATYVREMLGMITDKDSSDAEDDNLESEKETDTQDTDIDSDIDIDLNELSDIEKEETKYNERRVMVRRNVTKNLKRNEKGETSLHVACIKGNVMAVRKLLEEGHPVNVYDYAGFAPLHEAANFGFTEIVALLIQHGANVNDRGGLPTLKGVTPLHDACINGAFDTVKLLIKSGADPNLEYDGNTAYDCLKDWRQRCEKEENKLCKKIVTPEEEAEYLETLCIVKKKLTESPESRQKKKENTKKCVKPRAFINDLDSDSEDEVKKATEDNFSKRKDNEVSPVKDYKNAIENIKHRSSATLLNFKGLTKEEKAPLLDSEEILTDEWLDDDLGFNKKNVKNKGDGFNCKRKPSEMMNENVDRIKRQRFSDEVIFEEMNLECISKRNVEEVIQNLADNDSDTDDSPVINVTKKQRRYKQLSLENSGIKLSEASQSSSSVFETNFETNWIDLEPQKNVQLKIFVENNVYSVDVCFPRDNSKTVKNILDIVQEQFKGETGCDAELSLCSTDKLTINCDETLTVISMNGKITKFIGEVVNLTVPPTEQRYRMICKKYEIDVNQSALKSLQSCQNQSSFRFNLSETPEEQLLPVLKTIAYEPNLYTLCLSGLDLCSAGLLLDSTLSQQVNLTSLILENCDITYVCLSKLKQFPKRLKVLNLSYNPLGAKSQEKLYSLLTPLKELNTLELRHCDLTYLEFNSLSETLVTLDVSGNFLEQIKVENLTQRFLIHLNVSYSVQGYSDLSIVRQIINDSRILSFTLESLDFSCCKLRDTDVDVILRNMQNLRKIYLNNNKDITYKSVKTLLMFKPTLIYIGVVGCRRINEIPDTDIHLDNPRSCTMLVSMADSVITHWEALWEGTCVGNILAKHIVKFEPS